MAQTDITPTTNGADSLVAIEANFTELYAKDAVHDAMLTPASSATSAAIVLREDTDNGTNKVTLIAPASIASDKTITLPDATDTLVGKDTTDVLTNKTIDGLTNTITNVGNTAPPNLLSNGNFINNSTNGYGSTPDDWTSSNANLVQGGIPALTKQDFIDATGVANSDIQLLCNLNGNLNDLSSNAYNLTPGGSPTDDSNGLMGFAKKFVTASSQYASVTAPNVLVGGNQTWAIFVKPTALPGTSSRYNLFGHSDNVYGVQAALELVTDATGVSRFNFQLSGTTTNTQVTSDIVVQANKWYFVIGIFDSTNSLLKIYVNGILKSVAASGTHTTSGTQTVGVGRAGSYAGNYSSALMNMAIMVSKALTDNQVKKLFAETLYKGIKLRRATTNAIAYQDLSMDLVERLRGKTVALRAEMYQEVASTSQISILQTLASGSTSETIISATDATTGSWMEKVATGAIDATAVGIRIQLKHSTSDGNTWFKKVSLYEGSVLLPYDHSKNDWVRVPRLLRMDIPAIISGYQFEENRLYTGFTPSWTGFSSNPTGTLSWLFHGRRAFVDYIDGSTGVSNATTLSLTFPFIVSKSCSNGGMIAYKDNGVNSNNPPGHLLFTADSNIISAYKSFYTGVWTGSGNKDLYFYGLNIPIN